jgi:hypothetical protein
MIAWGKGSETPGLSQEPILAQLAQGRMGRRKLSVREGYSRT